MNDNHCNRLPSPGCGGCCWAWLQVEGCAGHFGTGHGRVQHWMLSVGEGVGVGCGCGAVGSFIGSVCCE